MKRFFISISIFCAALSAFCADNRLTQLNSAYKSGFYPGVVRYAEEILKTEKDSAMAFRASVYEGESLYRMGREDEALKILQKFELKADSDDSNLLNASKNFWIGRIFYDKSNYLSAQKHFFEAASYASKIRKSENGFDYYSYAILYGARCYRNSGDEGKSIPLLEYVIGNGLKFEQEEFEESAVNLVLACNNSEKFSESIKICTEIAPETSKLSEDSKYSLMILWGDAEAGLKNYRKAYDLYCSVLENGPDLLATTGMQRAYTVSSQHRSEIGEEPGKIFQKADSRLQKFPDFLSEFWTRLAIDAFNQEDYKKSLEYFENARVPSKDLRLQVAAIYRSEIAFITASEKNAGTADAIKILTDIKNTTVLEEGSEISDQIAICLARYNGLLKNWKECEEFASSVLSSRNNDVRKNAVYWVSVCSYEKRNPEEAVSLIEKNQDIQDASVKNIYAKSLAKCGKFSEAEKVYAELGEKKLLNNDGRLDYSRTLLNEGRLNSTIEQAKKATGDEAVYLSALASFNQRKWADAETGFSKVMVSKSIARDFSEFSRFYAGYAQYQLGNYEKSVENLEKFAAENPEHAFLWSANMTLARSAVLSKKTDKSVKAARNAVSLSKNENQKHEAVILLAGIYSDAQKFQDAVNTLKPYLSENSDFSLECKYRTADIFVRAKKSGDAIKYFTEVSQANPKTFTKSAGIIEESCYRLGEIQYSDENYRSATEYFENYTKKWPSGKFLYASIYFSADSWAKLGNTNRAILRFLQIVDSNIETTYRYGAEKNLVTLYQVAGEYGNAIEMAKKMIDDYGSQAIADGINDKLRELELYNRGNDKLFVQKQREFEKSGSEKTPGGRVAGTELAEMMANTGNKQNDARILAEKLLEIQKDFEPEAGFAAKNASLLGRLYRNSGENKKSAESYLKAAQFARKAGNNQLAARSFYGAVEAFDAATMYGDSKEVFNTMKELYPNNEFTKLAEKILEL